MNLGILSTLTVFSFHEKPNDFTLDATVHPGGDCLLLGGYIAGRVAKYPDRLIK